MGLGSSRPKSLLNNKWDKLLRFQYRHGVSPTIDSIGDPLADRRPLYSCHGRQGLPAKLFLVGLYLSQGCWLQSFP